MVLLKVQTFWKKERYASIFSTLLLHEQIETLLQALPQVRLVSRNRVSFHCNEYW
jgi:hypothetical protein